LEKIKQDRTNFTEGCLDKDQDCGTLMYASSPTCNSWSHSGETKQTNKKHVTLYSPENAEVREVLQKNTGAGEKRRRSLS